VTLVKIAETAAPADHLDRLHVEGEINVNDPINRPHSRYHPRNGSDRRDSRLRNECEQACLGLPAARSQAQRSTRTAKFQAKAKRRIAFQQANLRSDGHWRYY
jgi:hypothetical protein